MSGASSITFATPEEAASALLHAIQMGDYPQFLSIAGSRMVEFWYAGDPERDEIRRHLFLDTARHRGFGVAPQTADRAMLYVGDRAQLFPAPLVKTGSGWRFDDESGFAELKARRIRRDEIAAVESCRRFQSAEFSYFGAETAFAQKIRCSPGKHDGLVGSDNGDEDGSPVGPAFAAAAFAEQQPWDKPRPFFGYYFKIVPAQVPDSQSKWVGLSQAPTESVALIAWPAEYGISGIRTFVINDLGDLYAQDLGPKTETAISTMTVFRPDSSWSRVEVE